jgi:pyruvate dehydrogenase E1 component alpha subunit
MRCRAFQLNLNSRLLQGEYDFPIHLAIGQEAAPAALSLSHKFGDSLFLTHRNIHYNFCMGGGAAPILQSFQMKRGLGAMNLALQSKPTIYSSSILGNNFSVATGMALANKLRRSDQHVYVVTGDGAIEEGAFWEAVTFAESHQLNMTFIVENNDHSLASSISERRCRISLEDFSRTIGVSYIKLDGAIPDSILEGFGKLNRTDVNIIEIEVHLFCNHAGPTPGWDQDPKRSPEILGMVYDDKRDPLNWIKNNQTEIFFDCYHQIDE